MMNNSVTEFD
jgi:hypothetical protein